MNYKIRRLARYILLVFIDAAILLGSWELAFYVNGSHLYIVGSSLPFFYILGLTALQILLFFLVKLYRISLRSVSLELVYKGALALFVGNIIALLVVFTKISTKDALRLLIPYWGLSTFSVFFYRISWRMTHGYNVTLTNHVALPRTLIYGAGEVGEQLLRMYRKDALQYKVIGLVDDNPSKWGTLLHGLPVLGNVNKLEEYIHHERIDTVIIATVKINQENLNKVLDITSKLDLQLKIIPSIFEIDSYQRSITDIRDIQVEDLLGRDPVEIERYPILEMVRDKTVLITGAGGSIGSEIASQIQTFNPKKLIILDIDETEIHNLSLKLHNYTRAFSDSIIPVICDVRDKQKVKTIFQKYQPDIVYHAAACKHVPLMEHFPEEALRTNIAGTYNILTAAKAVKTDRCIIISTDKAVNPTNVMGATKRMAELLGSSLSDKTTEIVSVRFGNVLNSRGSMLPLFMDQIQNGLPVTVTHKDIIRYFMTIPEAVSLVFLAGAVGKGGEVMVLDMGKPVRIYDFAQKLIKRYGDGRSTIKITGLREGEKLYEELLTDNDLVIPTKYEKIFKAKVENGHDIKFIERFIEEIGVKEKDELLQRLYTYVPRYDSESMKMKEVL